MRVLIVAAYWPPHRGGIEAVAYEQACRLARRGYAITVVTSRLAGDPCVSTDDGFTVHRVEAGNALETQRGIPFPVFGPRLLPLLGRLAPLHDVVLIHNHSYLSSAAAAIAARLAGRPSVVIQYSPFVEYRFPWNVVQHGADIMLGRHTLRSGRRVMAISEHTGRYVKRLIGDKPFELLNLGVDTRRFTPVGSVEARDRIRAKLGLPPHSFIVFTVRRLVARNGLDTLIEASAQLRRQDVLVVVGGRGPERAVLEHLIEREKLDNVRLAGFIPDEQLPDYYRAADAFVLPTRSGEGFGLVLLEAFASGIPAIATRGGGQEEVIHEGHTGSLVPPGDPDALARAVLELRDQPERRLRMGEAARIRATQSDWESCVDQLATVLAEAAGGASEYDGQARSESRASPIWTAARPASVGGER